MNLTTLAIAGTLVALLPNARDRTDSLALGVCIGCLLAVFAVTTLDSTPHRLVLGTSVAGFLGCLCALTAVTAARLRDRVQVA